ncbi:putative methyltransferase PMT5 [Glycine soja]|uniref:Putative methyltransferase PMT5 n=1 Tax=Glycine soja TaxID=3848 RepID=A0A445LZC4_GLYSO|nr:putative methyltransferase PMT5 [Glycine soja]
MYKPSSFDQISAVVFSFETYLTLHQERFHLAKLLQDPDEQGWVILSDNMGAIEMARTLAAQVRWEARIIDLQNGSDQRLLVCQKPFLKK